MNKKASIQDILRMFSVLENNVGDGINDFDAELAQEIIDNGKVCGRDFMRFLRNRARFDLRHDRPHFFIVTSDGRKPREVSDHLAGKGSTVGMYAESVINHPNVAVTSGVTYLLGVLFGNEFTESARTSDNIIKKASYRGWSAPPVETAHLLREKVTDEVLKQLGLWRLVVMHDPLPDSRGVQSRLALSRSGEGQYLGARNGRPDAPWNDNDGFVFLVPQIV